MPTVPPSGRYALSSGSTDAYLFDGFGSSQNRFLHDVTINEAGDRAYLSNWDAGLVLLDISDPYNPVETGRYNPGDEEFEEQNGGIQDLWGVYEERNSPWIYGSDRNGGLYVLKLLGSGSDKRNR